MVEASVSPGPFWHTSMLPDAFTRCGSPTDVRTLFPTSSSPSPMYVSCRNCTVFSEVLDSSDSAPPTNVSADTDTDVRCVHPSMMKKPVILPSDVACTDVAAHVPLRLPALLTPKPTLPVTAQ